jgi:hypothetical protein
MTHTPIQSGDFRPRANSLGNTRRSHSGPFPCTIPRPQTLSPRHPTPTRVRSFVATRFSRDERLPIGFLAPSPLPLSRLAMAGSPVDALRALWRSPPSSAAAAAPTPAPPPSSPAAATSEGHPKTRLTNHAPRCWRARIETRRRASPSATAIARSEPCASLLRR